MSILNPIKRIYINGDQYPKICIELELPKEFDLGFKKTKKLILQTDTCSEKDEIDALFDIMCNMFGITIQKSSLAPVTFVNMFCSDNDAKLSDIPQQIPKQRGVLL